MECELTCLYGCDRISMTDSRESVDVLAMGHMDDEHGMPADPLETDELVLKYFDDASLRQAQQ